MTKILVPVDGSASALAGVRHAIRLAGERAGASILLVNVQPVFHRHIAQFASRRALDGLREERGHEALDEARRLVRAAGIPSRALVLGGEAAAEIAGIAGRERVDQIVLGARRRPAWLRALAGSVADRIVERAQVPVALVPGLPAGRLERWGVPAAGAGLAAALFAAAIE